ncbi:MAG: asparagine synthase (glutamine-hydrolyzing) [Bacteroidetes bacterium]|nr:asparagine synthase (glutamine-hydrolyzing) [Bacteroidota bacterium]
MCGICGVYYQKESNIQHNRAAVEMAVLSLNKRGPENSGIAEFVGHAILGHARLAIIDTSSAANQPFTDPSGRYTIAYNGEIFNFKKIKQDLSNQGLSFNTSSDTEVLLYNYILKKEKCLDDLQGFFAFAIYDNVEKSIFLARDRFGVKPLFYLFDGDKLMFASELKAMIALGVERNLDYYSLANYLHLNYIPGNYSIFKNVSKLAPGHYMKICKNDIAVKKYFEINSSIAEYNSLSYNDAQKILQEKLEDAVQKRLVSDVPLGAFLSGGIDSSVIAALAVKHKPDLKTFSIGFKDEPMFDETNYANMVAKMHKTDHTAFILDHNDLLDCLNPVLEYTDEPFADSSALAVYILSRQTRQQVTVALSGDGADEIFGGYNKHMAEYKVRQGGAKAQLLKTMSPFLGILPQSRNNPLLNKFRQLNRFSKGMSLSDMERYWQWAGFLDDKTAIKYFKHAIEKDVLQKRKEEILCHLSTKSDLDSVLLQDTAMVLTGDMLTKVDMMSMANSLEVRTPFLDHDLVNFVFSLPSDYKIDKHSRKKILKDTFRTILPEEILSRPKHGFEVPMLKWFKKELRYRIENEWLAEDFIVEQNIFEPKVINKLKKKLYSANPEDSHATVWALIVFQNCWKKWTF